MKLLLLVYLNFKIYASIQKKFIKNNLYYKNIPKLIENKNKYNDIIHKTIKVSNIANCIIDTPIFQRLRNLHQMGIGYFIFQNSNHNRFEHSIGTYHLCGNIIKNIIKNSETYEINSGLIKVDFIKNYLLKKYNIDNNEKNINKLINYPYNLFDDYLIELVKIGGLCHDLGHGPFSHLFDNWLINKNLEDNYDHELRSTKLVEKIFNETEIILNDKPEKLNTILDKETVNFICNIINPNNELSNNFIFNIVSNSINGFDVDKLDYISRDSYYLGIGVPYRLNILIENCKIVNNMIIFNKEYQYELYKMYRTRYDLHKQYYNDKKIISLELMIMELFELLDKVYNITNSLKSDDLENFINLNDLTILNSYYLKNIINEKKIKNLFDRIITRKMYKCIYQDIYKLDEKIDLDEIKKEILEKNDNIDINKIIIKKIKIGLLSKNINPIENIYFYDNDIISKGEKISYLISENFQEFLLFGFYYE